MNYIQLSDLLAVMSEQDIKTLVFIDRVKFPDNAETYNLDVDGAEIMDSIEKHVLAKARPRLQMRFNVDREFAKTGDARDYTLVVQLVPIYRYYLELRNNSQLTSPESKKILDDALKDLESYKMADLDPTIARKDPYVSAYRGGTIGNETDYL